MNIPSWHIFHFQINSQNGKCRGFYATAGTAQVWDRCCLARESKSSVDLRQETVLWVFPFVFNPIYILLHPLFQPLAMSRRTMTSHTTRRHGPRTLRKRTQSSRQSPDKGPAQCPRERCRNRCSQSLYSPQIPSRRTHCPPCSSGTVVASRCSSVEPFPIGKHCPWSAATETSWPSLTFLKETISTSFASMASGNTILNWWKRRNNH